MSYNVKCLHWCGGYSHVYNFYLSCLIYAIFVLEAVNWRKHVMYMYSHTHQFLHPNHLIYSSSTGRKPSILWQPRKHPLPCSMLQIGWTVGFAKVCMMTKHYAPPPGFPYKMLANRCNQPQPKPKVLIHEQTDRIPKFRRRHKVLPSRFSWINTDYRVIEWGCCHTNPKMHTILHSIGLITQPRNIYRKAPTQEWTDRLEWWWQGGSLAHTCV